MLYKSSELGEYYPPIASTYVKGSGTLVTSEPQILRLRGALNLVKDITTRLQEANSEQLLMYKCFCS